MTSATSLQTAGTKRAYQPEEEKASNPQSSSLHDISEGTSNHTTSAIISAFRNVSACNRCRVRKNKCDQHLPACAACAKAQTRCVGFDPITKTEIPRSYVYFLETRMQYLESLLGENKIPFEPADAFEGGTRLAGEFRRSHGSVVGHKDETDTDQKESPTLSTRDDATDRQNDEKIDKIVSDIGMVSVHGASDRRYLGSTSGISFARVVLAAIKSSVPAPSEKISNANPDRAALQSAGPGASSMRDSYFGLSIRPNIKEAPFPDKDLGMRLTNLYFEHANPQIPILHRVEFMQLFDQVYAIDPAARTPRQLYLLNIVFAIGAGVIFGSSDSDATHTEHSDAPTKRIRLASLQAQPEEYHASAIVHLNSFFTATTTAEVSDKPGGDLEDLQAILLLAGFALLRPVAPGLWYIIGVAMRLAVDLGLHYEDGLSLEGFKAFSQGPQAKSRHGFDAKKQGKREWLRDMRRRLWWCTYCFDRLVSTCVGRPFGITDTVVTTEFPSLLEDKYITKAGFVNPPASDEPTYKLVARHYLRLRLLQSEILQVLQYQQAQQARTRGANSENSFILKDVESPFLAKHSDFRSWRINVDQRLWEWRESAPRQKETGVAFSPQFLELNYWQAVIMLYRNSLSVPEPFVDEISPTEEVATPTSPPAEDKEDQDLVFLKCAEAGQKTLKIYRQLHRRRLVNYTYLATHHLFMAGISFLYAVWHSPVVRSRLTLDDFDFTVLAATSVLGDLMEKCPPAKACRDAFERMSKATVQMCMSTPGFKLGQSNESGPPSISAPLFGTDAMILEPPEPTSEASLSKIQITRRPPPQFDMDLRELFPDDFDMVRRPSVVLASNFTLSPHVQQTPGMYQEPVPTSRHQSSRIRTNSQSNVEMSNSRSLNMQSQTSPRSYPMDSGYPMNQQHVPSHFNIHQNSYNPDFMSNMPGMEFLNNLGSSNTNTNSNTANHSHFQPNPSSHTLSQSPRAGNSNNNSSSNNNNNNMTILPDTESSSPAFPPSAPYDSPTLSHTPTLARYDSFDYGTAHGFDFGVGMGFDLYPQHGWQDPQQGFDLDGFFFGGNPGPGQQQQQQQQQQQ